MRSLSCVLLFLLLAFALTGGQDHAKPKSADNPTPGASANSSHDVSPQIQSSTPQGATEANNEKQDTEQKPRRWLTHGEWVMAILTFIYVALTAFYVCISYGMLHKIEEQIEVADRAAEAAEDAANRTRQLERPWIILDWGKGYETRYDISIRNCGRTVARITDAHTFIEIRNSISELPEQPYYGIAGDSRDLIFGPNDKRHLETFDIVKASDGQWSQVFDGQKVLIYWGCIRYQDADRNLHQTRFCYRYDKSKGDFVFDGPLEYNKFT